METSLLLRRIAARWRAVDLDSSSSWPSSVSVVESDEHGPLVISIRNATVFPDGSVTAGGRWFTSERFRLRRPNTAYSEITNLGGEHGFVHAATHTIRETIEEIGPQMSTLGRLRPGIGVIFSATNHYLGDVVSACGVQEAGRFLSGGFAFRVDEALVVRVPNTDDDDGQVRLFASRFAPANGKIDGALYLEDGFHRKSGELAEIFADNRYQSVTRGAILMAIGRKAIGSVLRSLLRASEVTIETTELGYLERIANPSASVDVLDPSNPIRRRPSAVALRERFDMDTALREGLRLPKGVEIISRPDYDVEPITVDNHRVFDRGAWRPQSPDVLSGRALGPYLVSVTNAIVTPNDEVLLEDGTLLEGDYFGGQRRKAPVAGWIASDVGERAGLAVSASHAFGHILLQVAPRVDALTNFDPSLRLLVNNCTWDDNAILARAGASLDRITRIPTESSSRFVRVPELIVSTHLQPERRTAPSDPRWFTEFVSRFTDGLQTEGTRRIHMARRTESGLRSGCVNRHEIHALADDFGYETVYPETLSLDDQIRLVTGTTEMFGEQGSALTWAMFMRAGSELVVVDGKPNGRRIRFHTYYNSGLAARGSRHFHIGAVRAGRHGNFEIDPEVVRRALERRR